MGTAKKEQRPAGVQLAEAPETLFRRRCGLMGTIVPLHPTTEPIPIAEAEIGSARRRSSHVSAASMSYWRAKTSSPSTRSTSSGRGSAISPRGSMRTRRRSRFLLASCAAP